MPQYQFLDRIINTISLQTKPTSKFKKLNRQLFTSVGSILIENQLDSFSLNSLKFPFLINNDQSLFTQNHIQAVNVDTSPTISYLSSSASLQVLENFDSLQESSSSVAISFFPETTAPASFVGHEGNFLLFNVQETLDSYTVNSSVSTILVGSQSSTKTTYVQEPYSTYPLSYSYSGVIVTPTFLYVPKVNDDMLLALDLEFNQIFQYIEPQDVEEYVPPNPEDLTIITLKEFWG